MRKLRHLSPQSLITAVWYIKAHMVFLWEMVLAKMTLACSFIGLVCVFKLSLCFVKGYVDRDIEFTTFVYYSGVAI